MREKKIRFKIKTMYLNQAFPRFNKDGEVSHKDFEGEVFGRLNGKKIHFRFITNEKGKQFKIAFLDCEYLPPPRETKEIRRAILIETYASLHKKLAKWEIENFFIQEDKEEQERILREKREREAREIKLGEQISIEKYLLNK